MSATPVVLFIIFMSAVVPLVLRAKHFVQSVPVLIDPYPRLLVPSGIGIGMKIGIRMRIGIRIGTSTEEG